MMGRTEGGNSPKFTFQGEEDARPGITKYSKVKFYVGDRVYLRTSGGTSREGPYHIASTPSTGVYTLSLENGQSVKNGAEIEEKDLEAA